jgi:hypothetical protein
MSYVESDQPNGKTGDKSFHGLESLREELSRKQAILPAVEAEAAPTTVTASNTPPASAKRSQREILTELAAMANVSVGTARQAHRLARSGHANLLVAALLQLIPISTALRNAKPPKQNAPIARWQAVAALAGETQ